MLSLLNLNNFLAAFYRASIDKEKMIEAIGICSAEQTVHSFN
jgi:hypothetical protein